MKQNSEDIEAFWNGPYSWPKFEAKNGLPHIPRVPGVYLQTFEYRGGYLIYAAGITRRPVPVRFREHTQKYMNGEYNVLDPSEAERGIRQEIWHGWGYARNHRDQFEARKLEIQEAVQSQLARFRIFVAEVGTEPRILERIEASIMNHLSKQLSPYCDIPDQGMMLAPRWDQEKPIFMNNRSTVKLCCIPETLEI